MGGRGAPQFAKQPTIDIAKTKKLPGRGVVRDVLCAIGDGCAIDDGCGRRKWQWPPASMHTRPSKHTIDIAKTKKLPGPGGNRFSQFGVALA